MSVVADRHTYDRHQPGNKTPIYSTLSAISPNHAAGYQQYVDGMQDTDARPASRNWRPISVDDNERLRREGFDTASTTYAGSSNKRQTAAPSRTQSRGSRSVKGKSLVENTAQADDNSKWIHRDKLAQIESQELREMSFRLGLPAHVEGGTHVQSNKHDKRGSFYGRNVVQDTGDGDIHSIAVFTQPEERRPDSMVLNSISSPLVAESRTTTSHRTRSPEADNAEPLSSTPQAYLTALEPAQGDLQVKSTPSTKRPGKSGSGTHLALKKSLSQQKRSTVQKSGEINRASMERRRALHPAARPEGDAPWLAEMYKPDPRLPQEEQIIPTHAKRLAREREETYDVAPSSSGQPQSFLLEPDDPESDEAEKSRAYRDVDITGQMLASHNIILPKQVSARRLEIASSNNLLGAAPLSTYSGHSKSNENIRMLNSPFEVGVQEWPLSSTRVDISPSKSAISIRPNGDVAAGRVSRGSDRGSYQLTPVIRTKEEMEQRLGQQPGVGGRTTETETPKLTLANTTHVNTTSSIDRQATSIPERRVVSKFDDDKPDAAVKSKKKRRKRFLCF